MSDELQHNLEVMTEDYYTKTWCIIINDSCLMADANDKPNCKQCSIAISHLKRVLGAGN